MFLFVVFGPRNTFHRHFVVWPCLRWHIASCKVHELFLDNSGDFDWFAYGYPSSTFYRSVALRNKIIMGQNSISKLNDFQLHFWRASRCFFRFGFSDDCWLSIEPYIPVLCTPWIGDQNSYDKPVQRDLLTVLNLQEINLFGTNRTKTLKSIISK